MQIGDRLGIPGPQLAADDHVLGGGGHRLSVLLMALSLP
jgi:hypothetical protein